MVKAGLFGAIALFLGSSLALADGSSFAPNVAAKYETVMSSAHVAKLKTILKLTAEQEPHWPAIDRAFREISQSQAASPGFVQGIKQRVAQVALNSLALLGAGARRHDACREPGKENCPHRYRRKSLDHAPY